MSISLSSAKLTASPNDTGWAQAYDFEPDDGAKLKKRGHLFAVISTSTNDEGLDSVLAGREILTRLHEEYFGNLEDSPIDALKRAITKIINEFSSWEDVEIACMSFVSGVLYLAVGGGARIFIVRNGNFTEILKSERSFVSAASGYPKPDDFYFAATDEFYKSFAQGTFKGILQGKTPQEAVEAFAPTIHSQDKGNMGAFFVSIKEKLTAFSPVEESPSSISQATSFLEKPRNIFEKLFDPIYEKAIYLKTVNKDLQTSQKSKVSLSAGLALLAILVISIFFGIRQKRISDFRQTYESELAAAIHEIEEAEELYPLNQDRARELFESARGRVLGLSESGVEDEELQEIEKTIEENRQKILGEYRVETSDYLDLSLLTNDFSGTEMVFSQGKVIVLDSQGKRIVSVEVDGKRADIVSGPAQIDEAHALAAYADRVFILADDGIYEVGPGRTKVLDEDWIGDILIYSYTGNFYILEKSSSSIRRHQGSGGEFTGGANWLIPGTSADLQDASSWVIDGAIWVLNDRGEIRKFSLGNPVRFEITGAYPQIELIDSIFTDEEAEYLYVLERQKQRIVVLDKDGNYKAQYISDRIQDATQIAVSEDDEKIILLSGGKLLSLELKHL